MAGLGAGARLGIDVRLNRLAEAQDVLDKVPDVVAIATGGLPNVGHFTGTGLAATSSDVLAGACPARKEEECKAPVIDR